MHKYRGKWLHYHQLTFSDHHQASVTTALKLMYDMRTNSCEPDGCNKLF